MLSCHFKSFKKIRVLALGLPLMLAACHSDLGPYPMPTGYKHHDKLVKAAPGPEPVMDKIEHMRVPQSTTHAPAPAPMPVAVAPVSAPPSAWVNAGNDLIRRMTDNFGKPVEAVFISPPDMMSEAELNLEKSLRGAMNMHGYNIAPAPGMGPFTLRYHASPMDMGTGPRSMVTITLIDANGETVAEESGIYNIGMVAAAPIVHAVPSPDEPITPGASSGAPVMIAPVQ